MRGGIELRPRLVCLVHSILFLSFDPGPLGTVLRQKSEGEVLVIRASHSLTHSLTHSALKVMQSDSHRA